jgi:hypothetical protein
LTAVVAAAIRPYRGCTFGVNLSASPSALTTSGDGRAPLTWLERIERPFGVREEPFEAYLADVRSISPSSCSARRQGGLDVRRYVLALCTFTSRGLRMPGFEMRCPPLGRFAY